MSHAGLRHRTLVTSPEAHLLGSLRGRRVRSFCFDVVRVYVHLTGHSSVMAMFRSGTGAMVDGTVREVIGICVRDVTRVDPTDLSRSFVVDDLVESIWILNTYVLFGAPAPIDLEPVGESKVLGGEPVDVRLVRPDSRTAEQLSAYPGSDLWLNEVDVGLMLTFRSGFKSIITTQGFTAFVNLLEPSEAFTEILEQTLAVPVDVRL